MVDVNALNVALIVCARYWGQGDCLTDYKAQGIKGAEVRGIEDNGSAMAMANKEAFHVKGTRHVKNLVLHVENKGLYAEAIQRSNNKFSALQLERMPIASRALAIRPQMEDRSRLLLKVSDWGRHFLKKATGRKVTERLRQQFARWEAMRPRLVQVVAEKITPTAKETVAEKLTPAQPTVTEKLREGLSKPVEEMAERLRQKRHETVREQPAPPVERPKQTPRYAPTVTRPQPRRGYRM